MDAEELRTKATQYRKLAEGEPPDEMRDELMRVVAALEEMAAKLKTKKTSIEISNALRRTLGLTRKDRAYGLRLLQWTLRLVTSESCSPSGAPPCSVARRGDNASIHG